MKMFALTMIALVLASPDGDGRKANDLYRDGKYREAADAYLATLEELGPEAPVDVQAALLNNLADLYHQTGQTEQAMQHLKQAVTIFAQIGDVLANPQPEIWKLTEW